MSEKAESLEQRLEEFHKHREFFSWSDDFPLLSIRPKEKILLFVKNPIGPYCIFEGDTLIVGITDEHTYDKTPVCAVRVTMDMDEKASIEHILNEVDDKNYDRIIFDREYTGEEKENNMFYAKILQGIDLEPALEEWRHAKNNVTQEEIDEEEAYIIELYRHITEPYGL